MAQTLTAEEVIPVSHREERMALHPIIGESTPHISEKFLDQVFGLSITKAHRALRKREAFLSLIKITILIQKAPKHKQHLIYLVVL